MFSSDTDTVLWIFFSTVNVEEWLASAQAESLRAEEEAESLRSSQGSVFTDGSMVSDLDNTRVSENGLIMKSDSPP